MEKRICAILLAAIMLSSFLMVTQPTKASAQQNPVLTDRGRNYETWRLNATHFQYVSAPPWVYNLDTHSYVPYIFKDNFEESGYRLLQNAYITVRLYDDHAQFWDADNTEIRVAEEQWFAQYYDGEGWCMLEKSNPSIHITTNASGVFAIQTWTAAYSTDAEGSLTVVYALREATPLESFVVFTNNGSSAREFRIVQSWSGVVASGVKDKSGAEIAVTSPVNVYSLCFEFTSADGSLAVFEDLRPTGYYADSQYRNDILQPTSISRDQTEKLVVSFMYSNRDLYTLSPGASLTFDPLTRTISHEHDLSGYIVKYGSWPESSPVPLPDTDVEAEYDLMAGKEKVTITSYYLWRGFVSFDTSSIPSDATITGATLSLYLDNKWCAGENGWENQSFEVWAYSGKDKWSSLTADAWYVGGAYELLYQISRLRMDFQYYSASVCTSSIAYGNDRRTQFKLVYCDPTNLFDYDGKRPEYGKAVQWACFRNPYGDQNVPKLEVQYTRPCSMELHMDETSGYTAYDSSGNSNNAAWNGCYYYANGKINHCLAFDGVNDYAYASHASSLVPSHFTVSAWVKRTANSEQAKGIVTKGGGWSTVGWSLCTNWDQTPRFILSDSGGDTIKVGSNVLPLDTWTFLCATYDGSYLRLYVDGQQVGDPLACTRSVGGTYPVNIGRISQLSDNYFPGYIDEVHVWSCVLSSDEILKIFNSGY